MIPTIKITIAEPSLLVRCGLETLLKRLPGFHLHISEIPVMENLEEGLQIYKPDILIVNPALPGCGVLPRLKEEYGGPDTKYFALVYTVFDPASLKFYDDQISIYDSLDELKHKLERSNPEETDSHEANEEQGALSAREKEIVICVVKGLTNREIAGKLYLSAHTVITHRRNIARKLQIHSASGLTIYAIVNKLVELSEIRNS